MEISKTFKIRKCRDCDKLEYEQTVTEQNVDGGKHSIYNLKTNPMYWCEFCNEGDFCSDHGFIVTLSTLFNQGNSLLLNGCICFSCLEKLPEIIMLKKIERRSNQK